MTTKKTPIPEKKAEVHKIAPKPEVHKPAPKVEEPKPQHEIDTANLLKQVAHLEEKTKSHSSQLQLMKSMVDSCEGMVRDLAKNVKKLAGFRNYSVGT